MTTEVVATQTTQPAVPLRPDTPWQAVAQAFLDAGIDSENTRRAYVRALGEMATASGISCLTDLTGAQLASWRAALTTGGLTPATVAQKLAAVRSFLAWSSAMQAHALPEQVIRTALKTPRGDVRRPYQVLSEGEIVKMVEAAGTLRDRALVAVLLGAGLRVSEVVSLDVGDVVEDGEGNCILHVRSGKGRKSRSVPIQPEVAAILRAYLESTGRRLGQDGPLFRAHDRGATKRSRSRLTARSVGYLVEKLVAAAGIDAKSISPHSLRHTYALRTLRYSGNVVAVSKLLGHAQLTTTQRYVDHLALDELRQAVPPLAIPT